MDSLSINEETKEDGDAIQSDAGNAVSVKKDEDDYRTSESEPDALFEWFKMIGEELLNLTKIYCSPFLLIGDMITDYMANLEFGLLVAAGVETCGTVSPLNMRFVFTASLFFMIAYRIFSAYKIWELTRLSDVKFVDGNDGSNMKWKRIRRVMLQLLDLEIFQILYLSHSVGLQGSSAPQRLIGLLVAVLDAGPECVIQLVFLMASGGASSWVIASAAFSMVTLIMTVAGDDALFLEWSMFSLRWFLLHLYRILDIGSKLVLYALFWHLKGEIAFVLLLLNIFVGVSVYAMLNKKEKDLEPPTSALLLPAVTPLSLNGGNSDLRYCSLLGLWFIGFIESIVAVVLLWAVTDHIHDQEAWIYCAAIAASVGAILKWLMLRGILRMS